MHILFRMYLSNVGVKYKIYYRCIMYYLVWIKLNYRSMITYLIELCGFYTLFRLSNLVGNPRLSSTICSPAM